MYDTHCHPYLTKEKSQEYILENFFNNGGRYLNSIGIDIPSSKEGVTLAQKNTGVYATIGIHPTHALDYKGFLQETINKLESIYTTSPEKIVAIGEIGLDYYWLDSLCEKHNLPKEKIIQLQKKFFIAQIDLAKKLGLPIIIHNREASNDILEILLEKNCTNFVFHCFSEDLVFAKRVLDFAPESKLGFGGVTTFKNAKEIQEVVQNVPLKNIILETDSPYLTPVPYRGKQENEPLFVSHVLEKIIELRSEPPEELKKTIFQNSVDFFIKKSA